jgi:AP endonuclease-2
VSTPRRVLAVVPTTRSWNTLKTCEGILNELKADIICFQGASLRVNSRRTRLIPCAEMKSSRTALDRHAALPPSYDAFFSFPTAKGGYSGVGVYTSAHAVPLKAEEGLTGRLQPKPPLNEDERIGGNPSFDDMEEKLFPDEKEQRPSDLAAIDAEGRALVLDFGLFVLINVYCPNETSDARLPYKVSMARRTDRVSLLIPCR